MTFPPAVAHSLPAASHSVPASTLALRMAATQLQRVAASAEAPITAENGGKEAGEEGHVGADGPATAVAAGTAGAQPDSGGKKARKHAHARHESSPRGKCSKTRSANSRKGPPLHETARLDNEEYEPVVAAQRIAAALEATRNSQEDSVNPLSLGDDLEAQRYSASPNLPPPPPLDPELPLHRQHPMDLSTNHFRAPYSIVFGPLPLLSWLCPWVGHLGICDSEGIVHDFAGHRFVEQDSFMVPVSRVVQLRPEELPMRVRRRATAGTGETECTLEEPRTREERRAIWNAGVAAGDADFRQRLHSLLCNNCHHHVSHCFRHMGLDISAWAALRHVWLRGRFVSPSAAACSLLPPLLLWSFVVVILVVFLAI